VEIVLKFGKLPEKGKVEKLRLRKKIWLFVWNVPKLLKCEKCHEVEKVKNYILEQKLNYLSEIFQNFWNAKNISEMWKMSRNGNSEKLRFRTKIGLFV